MGNWTKQIAFNTYYLIYIIPLVDQVLKQCRQMCMQINNDISKRNLFVVNYLFGV